MTTAPPITADEALALARLGASMQPSQMKALARFVESVFAAESPGDTPRAEAAVGRASPCVMIQFRSEGVGVSIEQARSLAVSLLRAADDARVTAERDASIQVDAITWARANAVEAELAETCSMREQLRADLARVTAERDEALLVEQEREGDVLLLEAEVAGLRRRNVSLRNQYAELRDEMTEAIRERDAARIDRDVFSALLGRARDRMNDPRPIDQSIDDALLDEIDDNLAARKEAGL
jgi:hypothetical protein